MEDVLVTLLGCRSAALVMLYLFRYGEAFASGVAEDLGIETNLVRRQLERFEASGLVVSRWVGKARVYTFDDRHPATRKLKALVRVVHEGMPKRERDRLFPASGGRRRPGARRK